MLALRQPPFVHVVVILALAAVAFAFDVLPLHWPSAWP
jgi:hypothetical protein